MRLKTMIDFSNKLYLPVQAVISLCGAHAVTVTGA